MAGSELASRLDGLAATANREHTLAYEAAHSFIQHAMAAGDALLAAKAEIAHGEWGSWLRRNFAADRVTAQGYMRCARSRELIADSGARTYREALDVITSDNQQARERLREQARELARTGLSHRAIGAQIGVHGETIRRWLMSSREQERARAKRRSEFRSARRALRTQRLDALARRTGGSASRAYGHIRKAAQELDRAMADAGSTALRQELETALQRLYKAEYAVGRAMREADVP